MRLDQHVRNGDFALQVGTLASVGRILVLPDIKPGPAVKRALANPGDEVGYKIVPHGITLIGRAV